jgi:hypothetical protein
MRPQLVAALVTVAIETPIVAAFYNKTRMRMALVCAVATALTNLAMNLYLPRYTTAASFLVIGELAAFVIEAGVYLVATPGEPLRAAAASATANAASFGAGLLLL